MVIVYYICKTKQRNMEATLEVFVQSVKELAVEMIQSGIKATTVAAEIGKEFGNGIARLIMADIAIDLGMQDQVKAYLSELENA